MPLQFNRILKTGFGAWLGFFAIGLVLWRIFAGKFSLIEATGVTAGFCFIASVSSWIVSRVLRLRSERLMVLKSLADNIGETCNLAVVDRFNIVCLDRVKTHWPLSIQLPIGTKVPFH